MAYLLLILNPLSLALLRIFQKKYKNDSIKAEQSGNIYLLISCITALIFFAVMSKGQLIPNLPTLIYALFLALFAISSCLITIFALDKTTIVNITVFSGAGGIIIPFLYGVLFLNEEASILKIIACILLTITVILPLFSEKVSKKTSLTGYFLCLFLFFEAGAATVLYKLYAIAENVLDTNVFCFWGNVIIVPYLLFTSLKGNTRSIISDAKKIPVSAYIFAVSSILLSNFNSLSGVWALEMVDITVFTLVTSSLSLIMTAILSRIVFSEKITKAMFTSIVLSVIAIVLNAI